MKSAKDASSVTLAKGLRIKMEAAELAAVRYTEDARHKLTHAIAMHHEAKATFVKEHALLQEVDRRVKASAVITDAFEERQIACAHGARGHRQSLTEMAGLVATAQALPKRPWRLPKKKELAIRYDASALTLKKIKATALKAAESGSMAAQNAEKGNFLVDSNAEDVIIHQDESADEYAKRAQQEGVIHDNEKSRKERAVMDANQAMKTAKLALEIGTIAMAETGDPEIDTVKNTSDTNSTVAATANDTAVTADVTNPSPSNVSDTPAPVAPAPTADADAKAAADEEAKASADAAKTEANAAAKAKADQDASNVVMAKEKAEADEEEKAKKKKEEAKAASDKAAAEKKVRDVKKKEEAKAAEKKKEEAEQKALNDIKLKHTGMHDLKRSYKRAQGRLDRHFHQSKADLWHSLKKQIARLERSPGGTAARRAAMRIRQGSKTLESIYSARFAQLEATNPYAVALHDAVSESWWHQRYKLRLLGMKSDTTCGSIKVKPDWHQCKSRQKALQLQLAASLRAKDTTFQQHYAKLQSGHGREEFILRRKVIDDSYHQALDRFHTSASLKILALLEAEP